MKRKNYKLVPALIIFALMGYFAIDVYSKSGGITGRTSTSGGGCYDSPCHNTSANSATSLSVTSGSLSVSPSSKTTYTIRVSNSNSTQEKAGINIAVKSSATGSTNSGTLEPVSGSGLYASSGELTHSQPKELNSGNADFSFEWTAPSTPGIYYLRAAGNAVDGTGGTSGDQWNWMPVQEIIVKGLTLTEPVASGLSYCRNQQVTIKWTHVGVANAKIELSTNSGSSWGVTIQNSVDASTGTYVWTIPNDFQLGNQFRIRISDASSADLNSFMTNNFTIGGPFSIATHPESKDVCAGTNHSLKVSVNGGGVGFQWQKNGNPITGANDSVYTMNNVSVVNEGNYSVVVSSNCQASVTSNVATITIISPPKITKQPLSLNVCSGMTAEFSVTAEGDDLTYKWYFNSSPISDATTNQYIVNPVGQQNVGSYYCEVINSCGVVKSSTVELKLNTQPEITTQPQNVSICENASATFTVAATGLENEYEWYFNEQKLNVPVQNSLKIDNVTNDNAGAYHCIVKNSCGEPQRSSSATLTVLFKPTINVQPQSKSVTVGDDVEFNITASAGTTTYQWRKNGENISGATTSKYSLTNVTKASAGDYDCVVGNSCGTVNSSVAKLNVDDPIAGPGVRFLSESLELGQVFTDKGLDTTISNFITNNGSSQLIVDSIKIVGTGSNLFNITLSANDLPASQSADMMLTFMPVEDMDIDVTVQVYANTDEGMHSFNLKVKGTHWNLTTENSNIDFGTVQIGNNLSKEFVVFNQSDFSVKLISAEFDCDSGNDFVLVEPSIPSLLAGKQGTNFELIFNPKVEKSFECALTLSFEATDNTLLLNLKGEGKVTSVNDEYNPASFRAFPNPGGKFLSFEFTADIEQEYTIDIVNLEGNYVKTISGFAVSGLNSAIWDGTDNSGLNLPSGAYLALLKTNQGISKFNIVLISK